jgi:hypothetical protein
MLIEKPLSKNEPVTIKLSNGEEIIAKFQEQTHDKISISHPLCLIPSNQGGMTFAPWLLMRDAKSTIGIDRSHVISHGRPFSELADLFISQTSTIVPASGNILNTLQ